MKVIDPGHEYLLEGVGRTTDQHIVFVKNQGEKYPGNVGFHGGILTQELLRVCIDRTKYLNHQGSCMETELALSAMRQALAWYEVRAARCRGTHISGEHCDALDTAVVCETCGHNQCQRDAHERLPGTMRVIEKPAQGDARSVMTTEKAEPVEKAATVAWRCFHCGEVFTDAAEAKDHFGYDMYAEPGCKLNAIEGGLLGIVRRQEDQLQAYHREDTASYREFYALGADHSQALRREEEKGYERGLRDGQSLAAQKRPFAFAVRRALARWRRTVLA